MDSYSFNSTGDGKLAQPNVNELMIDSLPNWEAIDFEVMCSRCGYNLRLLPEPRCPECGLKFDWRVVLDESAWRSDFLFEHHWRARAIRSWLKTLGRSFRPFKFWKNISIHDRVHPGPLWFLLLTSVYWFVVALHGLAGLGWFVLEVVDQLLTTTSGWTGTTYLDALAHHFKDMATISFTSFSGYFKLLVICYFGPLAVSLGLLCSLRQTLGRCRIRTVQILRVVAYTS
ncbi:MAG: hypothetical protein JSV03_12895, partial [Planctomycetota bacterium]